MAKRHNARNATHSTPQQIGWSILFVFAALVIATFLGPSRHRLQALPSPSESSAQPHTPATGQANIAAWIRLMPSIE
jgi:hypothetical protein